MCWRPASRATRPALRPAAARLSRARLQLAQGDAAAGRGGLSRRRPRPARLRPHHRLGRGLRRRPRLLPHAQPGARRAGLVSALGYRSVAAVVGHDFGSPVAAWCALVRPDVFRSVVLMSAPFAGPAAAAVRHRRNAAPAPRSHRARPRMHAPGAAAAAAQALPVVLLDARRPTPTCAHCPQGVHAFLRAYYHYKSADWKQNRPLPLKPGPPRNWPSCRPITSWTCTQNMAADRGAGDALRGRDRRLRWLPDAELRGLQRRISRAPASRAGCSGIAARTSGKFTAELQTLLRPHASMCPRASSPARATGASTRSPARSRDAEQRLHRMLGCHLVDGAGHWVQQEQPQEVSKLLLDFLATAG